VRAILRDRRGNLWLGTDKGGLSRLDPETETFTHYRHDPGNPASLSSDTIYSIHEDKNGMLWIGTRTGGLNKFNPDTEQFTHYKHDPDDPRSLADDFIYKIYEDRAGTIWLGTYTGGINRFVPGAKNGLPLTFENYKHDPADPQSLSNNCVLTIYDDRVGRLWFGTAGGGLNRLIRNDSTDSGTTFIRYSERDGLPSNFVYGILEDHDGFLWLSTNTGLSKFDPLTGTFKNYDVRDGLQSNEFNGGAYFRDSTGQMFFGGIKGFNAFYPGQIRDNPYVPPIVITDMMLFNRPIPIGRCADGRLILEQSITETESIQLSYRDHVFSFEFAALNFSNPEKNRYRYLMEGFDENWIDAGTRRFVTYTNLNPGDYIFRVTGSNNDGVWNEEGTSLRITIHPPFWRELWFIVAAGSIFLLLLYAGYRRRMAQIEKRKTELENQVREKTESAEALQNALAEVERLKNRLQAENIYLQNEIDLVHNFENIVTRSEKLKQVLRSVEKVAATDATVLILGESGTGKELLARAVHRISDRGDRPLVKVNCSALPANLIESELFGHEKGAFTGAISKKIGRYELANGGTIFLDEIADLPLELQAKLLRVLQEGEFERLGNPKTFKVDARVIAATNRDLEQGIELGNFREDLFYRLNVFPITIPPLRERKEDIPILVSHFVHIYGRKIGKKIESIPKHVLNTLEKYDWPGNVRELENIIERAVIVSPGKQLVVGDWLHEHGVLHSLSHGSTLVEMERKHIIEILEMTGWRVSGEKGAAKILGLNPKTLDSKMRKLHIKRKK